MKHIGREPVDEMARILRIIAERDREGSAALGLLTFYTGMKQALSETDFRGMGDASDLSPASRVATRIERYKQFLQYRELFELELKLARRLRRQATAISEDWFDMPALLWDGVATCGPRLALRWAGISYRLGIPGAMDWCDAAATCMMRSAHTPKLANIRSLLTGNARQVFQ